MILAYLAICIPAFGPNFCYDEKPITVTPFETEEKCWERVDKFMKNDVKYNGTTITYHFTCADRA